jgi:transcriptional regulator with XRE-family HTH domain
MTRKTIKRTKSNVRKRLSIAFGQQLKKIRESKGLSQFKAAEKSGMEAGNFGKYESGRREPGLKTLFTIAAALEIKPGELLEFNFDFE